MKLERVDQRQVKRAALFETILKAAVDIVLSEGAEALSMAAIAKKTGLSRSGLYEYFASKEDLVADLLLDELKLWSKYLEESIDNDASSLAKLEGWLAGTMNYMKSGHHQLMRQLSAIGAPKTRVYEIRNSHVTLVRPLLSALAELGVGNPEQVAAYIQGILDTTVKRIDAGSDSEYETEYALNIVRAILSF